MSGEPKTNYENTNLNDFSFVQYKSVFAPFIRGLHDSDCVVNTLSDFWAFVDKYENLLRASGRPILPDPLKFDINAKFHSRKYLFINLNDNSRMLHNCPTQKKFRDLRYKREQFIEISLIYLDFKQKEKFKKLKELRKGCTLLPVYEYKENIQRAITDHQVLVLAGNTGCGKSTQIPQYLNELGYKNIACTQPRRLACLSLSKRVAHEMLEDYGSKVGYQIRFERNKTTKTEICFITEGLLLRQIASDAYIFHYDILILDEIHERNLHGDILLGVVKCLVKARRDLKIIIMSATINVDLFTNYFRNDDCLYIEVPGRLHPIKTFYMPQMGSEFKLSSKGKTSSIIDPAPYIKILSLIDKKYEKDEKGDLLIFVSGANEINNLVEAAKKYNEISNNWIILPLHSGLSLADQDKVFDYPPDNFRKCIISTNIAETSITIDGVRFVVDSGKVKEMSFDPLCKIQKLKEFWVSKSSAEQRKGRAGRTGPGICYRLYTSNDFDNFEAFPTPEIHRVQLESILLQMISMGLPNVRTFPFIERPVCAHIERAVLILKQHDAITADEKITILGKALAGIPVEISIGKMLLMSCAFQELNRTLLFISMISMQSPYTNRAFNDPKCERTRSSFISDQGDVFTIMHLFSEWLQLKQKRQQNTRNWCHDVGIEEQRFYEMIKLRNQFKSVLEYCNVIRRNIQDYMSSAERAIRYGEIKILKDMKRKQKADISTKKKILKTDIGGENVDTTPDIRDVDFRLRNNFNQIQGLIKAAKTEKLKNIVMMKLILASGYYPHIAIADELNFCQAENKQFFHTSSKQFVSIHPNSDMINNFDVLRLKESDTVDKPHFYKSKLALSSAHQILCYQNLLETSKPYILNAIRMQAAPTLLLFSFVIETDALITKVVCDSWICLEFPTPGSGQEYLLRAITLRKIWLQLMFNKLEDNEQIGSKKKDDIEKNFQDDKLLNELISFINSNIPYTIKRLLAADLKDLYTHEAMNTDDFKPNPFDIDFEVKQNEEKGGLYVTNNVVYACLKDSSWSMCMEEEAKQCQWQCKDCGIVINLSGISKILHTINCSRHEPQSNEIDERKYTDKDFKHTNTLRAYECLICKKQLWLRSIDILKHRNTCIPPL